METATGDDELLERARRLCLAARELQLPVLLSGFGGRDVVQREGADASDEARGDQDGHNSNSGSQRHSTDKLPLIAPPPPSSSSTAAAVPRHRKQVKQGDDREKKVMEEARRLEEEKKKHERESERVKQAQERARARVARTNQLEQRQSLRAAEQHQSDALSAADECAEKIRRAQESRRRAKERIRMKRREKTPDMTPPSSALGLEVRPAELKSFHRKTIKRLHASNQRVHRLDRGERQSTPERSDDIDPDQKIMERKLRQETTARLLRMTQQAENQKRQEQEEFEQGLQKYKSKLREMDRVAKGLSKQPSLPQINEVTSVEGEEANEKTCPSPTDHQDPSPVHDALMWSPNQDAESSSDSDESNKTSHPDQTDAPLPQTAEICISKPRLPSWKQPPVPIQPAQCSSYKAILPVYSRTSVTAPGYSAASTLGPATRLRAQEISRQIE
ncbi:hypothetical protein PF007_g14509 [Phytophthora fragariae]|nr:hypothetical protein PF007_g14509 [Phytophthora fragariae]KAE9142228.1 hypothetical protein PF006_g12649 [Phytophthora fragariae]KAE9217687.1 hypothetical protein PF004_g14083 [Phytophthora fragariae]